MSHFNDFFKNRNQYCFNNSWEMDGPLEMIWNELINYKRWPAWCGCLESIEPLDQFDHLRRGNNVRSVWKGFLPYLITFDASINDFQKFSFISFSVTGDLDGDGICHFLSGRDKTTVNFIWNVSPTKLWMKMSSPFARSLFIDNHDHIIGNAATGFAGLIAQKSRLITA